MHKGISGATFTLQDSGRGSSAVDQCTPEHMAERQVNHSKTQLVTEVASSALKVFGAYSLIMSSNESLSNRLISNSVHNKKKLQEYCVLLSRTLERVPSSATPRSAALSPFKRQLPPSAVTRPPGQPRSCARDARPRPSPTHRGALPDSKKK